MEARPQKLHRCSSQSEVVSALGREHTGVIAVDGFQGSGKTTLALELAKSIARRVVSADEFLHRNRGSFFEHLDLAKLSAAVGEGKDCILEGVCCLQMLQALKLSSATLVYVKRMAVWGWADEDELIQFDANGLPKEVPTDPLALALRGLWGEVAQYHVSFRPHEVACIVYERRET